MTKTLDHYNQTAERYAQVNHGLASAELDRNHFLAHLSAQADLPTDRPLRLLDAGSGSGRDTLAFLQAGFEVNAFDGSEAMAEVSSRLTGHLTKVMRFEALELPAGHYDGIWAMASLLHVPRADLPGVFVELGRALRPGGLLFASFKHGQHDRVDERDGREFTDLDEEGVEGLMGAIAGFEVVATAAREASTGQTNAAPWFSVILRRTGPELALRNTARSMRP